jgi:hypothetical protein
MPFQVGKRRRKRRQPKKAPHSVRKLAAFSSPKLFAHIPDAFAIEEEILRKLSRQDFLAPVPSLQDKKSIDILERERG